MGFFGTLLEFLYAVSRSSTDWALGGLSGRRKYLPIGNAINLKKCKNTTYIQYN